MDLCTGQHPVKTVSTLFSQLLSQLLYNRSMYIYIYIQYLYISHFSSLSSGQSGFTFGLPTQGPPGAKDLCQPRASGK